MLTTLDISDQILKEAKHCALAEGVPLKTVVARALASELANPVKGSRAPAAVRAALEHVRRLGRVRWVGPPETSPWRK